MRWTETSEATESSEGYPIPGTPTNYELPCRWVSGGSKVYRNEDNTTTTQLGRISFDSGVANYPKAGMEVEVVGHFKGIAKEVYTGGQLSRWRVDV